MVDGFSEKVLSVSFNSNYSFFAVGTNKGFRVYKSSPLELKCQRDLKGGIGLVQMLDISNIFCLSGGGPFPKYAPNKLILWDDKQGKEIRDFRFNSQVIGCKIKQKMIFVVCEEEISVRSLSDDEEIEKICVNSSAGYAVSHESDTYIFAWSDLTQGNIKYKDYKDENSKVQTIKAHDGKVICIELNNDGSMLATASDKGTLIRIFSTQNQNQLYEFRRGTEKAEIYDMAFDLTSNKYIGVTSDHGTVHLFVLETKEDGSEKEEKNQKSIFGSLSGITRIIGGGYFRSEWSYKQIKLGSRVRSILSIDSKNNVINVVGYNGRYISGSIKSAGESKRPEDRSIFSYNFN